MAQDIGDLSAGHSQTPIPTTTEAVVLEDTPHAPLPTTTAHTTPHLMDDPITPHAMILKA